MAESSKTQRPHKTTHERLHEYIFGETALKANNIVPKYQKDCENDAELTLWIVDELLQSAHNYVQRLLDENKVLRRLINIKTIRVKGEEVKASWDLWTPEHAYAFACYLFLENKGTEACKQCQNCRSTGPMGGCIAGDMQYMKGACACCYYSGSGKRCSRRLTMEEEEAEKKAKKRPKFQGFTTALLKDASNEEIELWLGWVEAEMEERASARQPPSKKRRVH
ncbi:hypothetical protein F5B22DRAFT_116387 [Xylaria bambusicola]|uniref:uncharacterized protein n=1 Tax=Xylaria bambusicola TaxID=326684 RepID=UPI002007E935|nr:uncharacterized protein F5B22DRAFT_116387 [Xylaria bambusicola]KAI0517298.1 hypothetical protein F5B22DRAFT_116387 [Xylaria bambusicola]